MVLGCHRHQLLVSCAKGTEVLRLFRATGFLQNASRKVSGFLSGVFSHDFRFRVTATVAFLTEP